MTSLYWDPTNLPIEGSLEKITQLISQSPVRSLVLTAEPGAGKSSLVPLAIANAMPELTHPENRRVLLLEPRRIAARATANRLAELINDQVGGLVGLTIRGEHSVSARTRIEVITEAVLTNRLQRDPELTGIGAIIFDEFHERNLYSDLGLAMALEAREALRDDLALIVMSATLNSEAVCRMLGDAPALSVPGRTFPVETTHLHRPQRDRFSTVVAATTRKALEEARGDALIFVPGRWEIDRVIQSLGPLKNVDVLGLHGGTPKAAQQNIIGPISARLAASRNRRVIVATAVAETSITVPGIEVVVDGGLLRRARYDPISGLGQLETRFTTRFSADQRRGRAGRLGPGLCFRLWSAEDDRLLDEAVPPEITDGDPLPLAFELSRWGDPLANHLHLLDHPGKQRLRAGQNQLQELGLVDRSGALTSSGVMAARLPIHPRTAAMVIRGDTEGQSHIANHVAAIVESERRFPSIDLAHLIDTTHHDRDLKQTIRRIERSLRDSTATLSRPVSKRSSPEVSYSETALADLLASSWPDRVGIARPGRPGHFLLASGKEAQIDTKRRNSLTHGLETAPFIIVIEANGNPEAAQVRLAIASTRRAIIGACGEHITRSIEVTFDEKSNQVKCQEVQRLGAITLHHQTAQLPEDGDKLRSAIRYGIRRRGLGLFNWTKSAIIIKDRLAWLHDQDPSRWPNVSDAALLQTLDQWIPWQDVRSPSQLRSIKVGDALLNLLDWKQRASLEKLAPVAIALPTGHPAKVDYSSGRPVWSVRLQLLLGLDEHPTIGPNSVPVIIELLSPANRPTQTTTDLPGFWRGSYQHVRSDLRGRYPKHQWPEDPLSP